MLVGFHGYAEDAEIQLERLQAIPQSANWLAVSIQGLHRFYNRRTDRVVASWMTRQDREAAIADNIAYVKSCVEDVAVEWRARPVVVFAGFSQGVAMAWRAAVNSTIPVAGVIAVGSDIPPELTSAEMKRVPAALIVRGATDDWYTKEKFDADERRLRDAGIDFRAIELNVGHEWSSEVTAAISAFLETCATPSKPPAHAPV